MVVNIPSHFCRDFILMLLGFLLTASPTVGINYLDTIVETYVGNSANAETARPVHLYSALENIRRRWERDGTSSWPMKTIDSTDFLMVLLIIQLEVTPHNPKEGNVPEIQNAYLPIVRDLVSENPTVAVVAN